MKRRELIKTIGTVVSTGVVTGCSEIFEPESTPSGPSDRTPQPTEHTTRDSFAFDTVLNAVDDLGMDPDGTEAIDETFGDAIADHTLIEFPRGEYRFDGQTTVDEVRNFGVRGTGANRNDVVFSTPATDGPFFLRIESGRNVLFENVTFDIGPGPGSTGLVPIVEDGLVVRNVEFVGFTPTANNGAVDNLRPSITDPDGEGIVDTFVRTGPTDITTHGSEGDDHNAGCIFVGRRHEGTLYIRNSHIENTGTNTIYASRTPGNVRIESCEFRNNNQTTLRLGGEGSYVKDSLFVADTENAHPDNEGPYINPHGVIWETGDFGKTGGFIENCRFVWRSAPERASPIIWVDGSAGSMTIRNSRIESHVDGIQPVRYDSPRNPRLGVTADRPWAVTLTDTVVTGTASGEWAAVEITGRDGTAIRNSRVEMSGECRGIEARNSEDLRVVNTKVNVPGEELVLNNAHLAERDIDTGDRGLASVIPV